VAVGTSWLASQFSRLFAAMASDSAADRLKDVIAEIHACQEELLRGLAVGRCPTVLDLQRLNEAAARWKSELDALSCEEVVRRV
jgi:hypothetical protein